MIFLLWGRGRPPLRRLSPLFYHRAGRDYSPFCKNPGKSKAGADGTSALCHGRREAPPPRRTAQKNETSGEASQTVKKVPSSRYVRMDGTHIGKLSAESVRGRKAECAVQRSILSPGT